MAETALIKAFKRLSQGSKQSVQSGQSLDALDKYLHVDRPIDIAVRTEMDNICRIGGGIVILVGSAGDDTSYRLCRMIIKMYLNSGTMVLKVHGLM